MSEPELKLVDEVDADAMAATIAKIGDGMQRLLKAGLSRKALIVLLKDSSGVTQYQIERVPNSLATLKKNYTTLADKQKRDGKGK